MKKLRYSYSKSDVFVSKDSKFDLYSSLKHEILSYRAQAVSQVQCAVFFSFELEIPNIFRSHYWLREGDTIEFMQTWSADERLSAYKYLKNNNISVLIGLAPYFHDEVALFLL